MQWDDLVNISRKQQIDTKQTLREELQKTILTALSHEGFFPSLVFQGGTALRLFYGNPRFSEDLDFVINEGKQLKDMNSSLSKIKKFIMDMYPFLEETAIQTQKTSSIIQRYILKTKGANLSQQCRIHMELAMIPSYDNHPRILDFPPYHPAIQVETKQEILADKITAIGCRSYIKGRDLWDIYYLTREQNVNTTWDFINKKINDYEVSREFFEDQLKKRGKELKETGVSLLTFELKRFLPHIFYKHYEHHFPSIIQTVIEQISMDNQG